MTFKQWQEFAKRIDERAKALNDSVHERGWALAKSVGIHRDMCSLHNASIDDELKGWCFQNPERLKVAKQANHLVNSWPASDIAERIIARAWEKVKRS